MYVPMKVILDDANKRNYGVIAANVINLELARGIINAAVEADAPIIINIGPGQMSNHGDGIIICNMVRELASRTNIPIALNLDHGKEYRFITYAFRHGFSSIMIDASECSLEENIRRTKKVAELAHSQGVTVEGELGHVGQAVDNDFERQDMYTNVEEAKRFVEETGVDALAVAVGTAHGSYPKGYVPVLDFQRLKEIKNMLNMPLVLHGGSNSGDENIRHAVECGINKVNICTDTFVACRNKLASTLQENPKIDYMKLMQIMEEEAKQTILHYIKIVGSDGKAGGIKNFYDPFRTISLNGVKAFE